jgi:hypothetical protein
MQDYLPIVFGIGYGRIRQFNQKFQHFLSIFECFFVGIAVRGCLKSVWRLKPRLRRQSLPARTSAT